MISRLMMALLASLAIAVGLPLDTEAAPIPPGPNIGATKEDSPGSVEPGDTVTYTVTITNTGDEDATGVAFDDTIDGKTTLTPGSIKTTPLARNDTYDALGNVGITVPAGSGVLGNDTDLDGGTVTVTAVQGAGGNVASATATAQGGSVTAQADGSFTYNPPPGFEGNDSFTYTVTDDEADTNGATVTITVADMVWFIDNSAGAGDGRLSSPFSTITAFNAIQTGIAPGGKNGDIVFLHRGSASYGAGILLRNDQKLFGQGINLHTQLGALTPAIVPPAFSHLTTSSPPAGTRSEIAPAASDGVTLAQNNLVRGLNVGNTPDRVGITDNGGTVGSLTIDTVSITGSGGGIEIDAGGTLDISLDSLSASSLIDEGVHLDSATGSFMVAGGVISANGITGVHIDGNPPLDLDVTLTSLSSAGGSAPGIDLKDTTGSFSVTGIGSTADSGGTISGKPIGVRLDNATNVSLSNMKMENFSDFAIRGTGVNGFTLADSLITGTNGNSSAADEGSVSFDNLMGTAIFEGSTIEGGWEDNIVVTNTAPGTLNMFVRDSASDEMVIGLNHVDNGNDGILVESQGSATLNLTVTNVSFLGARGDLIQANALGTSTMDVTLRDNAFQNGHTNSLGGGVTISGGSATSNITLTYDVSGTTPNAQTFQGAVSSAITVNIVNGIGGDISGTIKNNQIGVSGVPGSGSSGGSGISVGATTVDNSASMTHTVLIDGNDIYGVDWWAGIDVLANYNATVNATITNNGMSQFGSAALAGIYTIVGGATVTDTADMCAHIQDNQIDTTGSFAFDIFIDQVSPSATYRFPNYVGPTTGGATLNTFLAGQNTLLPGGGGVDSASAKNVTGGPGPCAPLPTAASGSVPILTTERLSVSVDKAIEGPSQAGLTPWQGDRLLQGRLEMADLADTPFPETLVASFRMDIDGARYGWFVAKTLPTAVGQFKNPSTRRR
ncbi:MAG: Ig-like domain-containing protein [Thermodesulfobacteriota bacterium]|nr:Ig-like domain-containing protein [Thermodesulfobacteriota bacterium]